MALTKLGSKEAVDRISEIESQIAPCLIEISQIKIWPRLRRKLWFVLTKGELGGKKENLSLKFHWYDYLQIPYYCFWIIILKVASLFTFLKINLSSRNQGNKLLFFAHPSMALVNTNKGQFDYRLDPYIEHFQDTGEKTLKLLCRGKQSLSSKSFKHRFLQISPYIFYLIFKNEIRLKRLLKTKEVLEFDELIKTLKVADSIFEYIGHEDVFLIDKYVIFFKALLKKFKPKAIFTTYYDCPEFMALNIAAKSLGIKNIDIQHGKQGAYNATYSHWNNCPLDGWNELPRYFWCWGQQSVNHINNYLPKHAPHKALPGGNLWIKRLIDNKIQISNSTNDLKLLEDLYNKTPLALISLQHDGEIPLWVIEALKLRQGQFTWLIRKHPVVSTKSLELIAQELKTAGINNFEMHVANKLSLDQLLRKTRIHLTGWSSVCYEALCFKVPTIFWDPQAESIYADYIDEKHFAYSNSSSNLTQKLNVSTNSWNFIEKSPYLYPSSQETDKTSKTIISDI